MIFSLSYRKTPTVNMPDLNDYMTTGEAAKALGYHIITIHKMVKKKKLEWIKFGNALMISRVSVRQYSKDTAGMSKNDPRRRAGETEK